jgi:hypothetical protein
MLRSEKPGRKPRSQVLKDAALELNGGEPLEMGVWKPGGMKFSPRENW